MYRFINVDETNKLRTRIYNKKRFCACFYSELEWYRYTTYDYVHLYGYWIFEHESLRKNMSTARYSSNQELALRKKRKAKKVIANNVTSGTGCAKLHKKQDFNHVRKRRNWP